MIDAYQSALDQLRSLGLRVDAIEFGRLTRVPVDDDKGAKKSGWYIAHEHQLTGGSRAIVGRFGNWKVSDEPQVLRSDMGEISEAERKQLQAKMNAAKREAEKEKAAGAAEARRRAEFMWPRLPERGSSGYLERKLVGAFGVRFARGGAVVVPVRDVAGALLGLQFIQADGTKKFLRGTPKRNSRHVIGALAGEGPIAIVEGYSTGASVHMATGWPVVVAFDAGNLTLITKEIRRLYPQRPIVVAGDDDHEAVDQAGEPYNKGRIFASRVAAECQAHLAMPAFADPKGRTDFNDMHAERGIEAVAEVLRGALHEKPPAPPDGADRDPWAFSHQRLLDQYTLIYGTVTVFDGLRQKIIGITELRAAAGRKVVDQWLNDPRRRIVDATQVVFDPTGASDPDTTVNLFRGFAMKPKRGDCSKQLALLYYLCGESDANFDWVLKWLAYPLQHPGAKMQSALMLHGPEGTGKNTFFGAIRQIYGDYGGVISQSELEDKHNGWASAKLFLIGNEVVSRAELYHQKGKLKNMITETEWVINEKHLPHRIEANHCNFTFFSNALQIAALDRDDRRYMILWTPPPREPAFYQAVAAEQRAGGIQGLYDYLLHYDLAGFDAHSKPLLTEAKQDLIELGLDTHERFFRLWKEGELKVPYTATLTMDLYLVYKRWCELNGERAAREVVFSGALSKRIPKLQRRYWDAEQRVRMGRFFVPPDWKPQKEDSEPNTFGEVVRFFRSHLDRGANAS
jgi:putative DNA primase/helicase